MTAIDWKYFPSKEDIIFPLNSRIVFKNIKIIQSSPQLNLFPKMATWRNKRKLAAMASKTQEYLRNNPSQNSAAPGIFEDYIAQVSEEIEGRVTKKLSQEFNRTESRILSALSKVDEFLLNPQIWTFSGTISGTFRNTEVEKQEPSGDRSQNDPHPEVGFSACRASNVTDSDPDETFHHNYTNLLCPSTFFFPLYTLFLVANKFVYTRSHVEKRVENWNGET